jgi:hypothetical protein
MVRRESSALIWENCSNLLSKYVKNSFKNGFLPYPPLELPDFPAQYPESISVLSSQVLGLFSIDRAGFNSKLSEIVEIIEPSYVKRHLNTELEREKWTLKNIDLISKRVIILQINDWFNAALDEHSPDTIRWYFAVSILIGMCYESSKICRDYCFNFILSISMARPPNFMPKTNPSGPHHIAWDPSDYHTNIDHNTPHPSGILAVNTIFDYLLSSDSALTGILPYWIHSLSTMPFLAIPLDLFSRIKACLGQIEGEQVDALIQATAQLMPDFPRESKDIIMSINPDTKTPIKRSLASIIPKIYSHDIKFTLSILDWLLIDDDQNTCVLATAALGFIIRFNRDAYYLRAPLVIRHGDQKALQTLVNNSIMEYLDKDITDKINILSDLWIKCNETSRSKLVSFISEQGKISPESFVNTATSIYNKDEESFLELYRWMGMRDEGLQNKLKKINSNL